MLHVTSKKDMKMSEKSEKFTMTDGELNSGMLKRGSSIFKAKSHRGTIVTFEEINLEEYDKRVSVLATKLAAMPNIDLLVVLKDALYDLSLDHLATVETKFEKEIKKEAPEVSTKVDRTYRGTCVNLSIGGRKVAELRH